MVRCMAGGSGGMVPHIILANTASGRPLPISLSVGPLHARTADRGAIALFRGMRDEYQQRKLAVEIQKRTITPEGFTRNGVRVDTLFVAGGRDRRRLRGGLLPGPAHPHRHPCGCHGPRHLGITFHDGLQGAAARRIRPHEAGTGAGAGEPGVPGERRDRRLLHRRLPCQLRHRVPHWSLRGGGAPSRVSSSAGRAVGTACASTWACSPSCWG